MDDKNQRTVLSDEEEDRIIDAFNSKEVVDEFSVVVSYEDIEAKNYSLSAGQYFEVKIEYVDITQEEFKNKLAYHNQKLSTLFQESDTLQSGILKGIDLVQYD